jgi:hypothetical protein
MLRPKRGAAGDFREIGGKQFDVSTSSMRVYLRLGEALLAVVLLLVPALWNGFPLLQYDSGGYLARWFEGYLVPSRSTVYGLFAVFGWPLDFWPEVILQAAAAVYVLFLVLRAYGFGYRNFVLIGTVAALCITTSLPFIAGILLTDIFAGASVLALHLLLFVPKCLGPWHRRALVLLVAFSTATHSATFAVLLAIVAAVALARLVFPALTSTTAVLRGAGAIALGAAMLVGTNFALSGQPSWTPGGFGIVFARMLQDGIVARYLGDHCAERNFRLCPYRGKLPKTADEFLWSDGPFNELGRFDGLGDEMRTIVLESLVDYPLAQLEAAIADTAQQLVLVESGEGVVNYIWHTYGIIDRYMPGIAPAMRAARQQRGEISFRAINRLHLPIALLSMALLPFVILMGWRHGFADISLLAGTVAVAILANAFMCGALSNPHDRYGARLVWIATLTVTLVPMRWAMTRRLPLAVSIKAPAGV